jgi:hypothetical protein
LYAVGAVLDGERVDVERYNGEAGDGDELLVLRDEERLTVVRRRSPARHI